jgi:hypothetical protein
VYIRATLFFERESQRGIVIGAGDRTIKAFGSSCPASDSVSRRRHDAQPREDGIPIMLVDEAKPL